MLWLDCVAMEMSSHCNNAEVEPYPYLSTWVTGRCPGVCVQAVSMEVAWLSEG